MIELELGGKKPCLIFSGSKNQSIWTGSLIQINFVIYQSVLKKPLLGTCRSSMLYMSAVHWALMYEQVFKTNLFEPVYQH